MQGRKLLILATTSQRGILDQMDLSEAFNAEVRVPTITSLYAVYRVVSVRSYCCRLIDGRN
jgi:vesicle-fusing ATPase